MKTASAPAFETARSGERVGRDCCAMSVSPWATSPIATRCARWPWRSLMLSPWYGATRRGRWAGSVARPRALSSSWRLRARPTPGCGTSARRRWRPAARSSSRQWFDSRPLLGPGQHEEQVREPIRVAQHFRIAQLTALLQADDAALRAAQHRARNVQRGGRWGATRDDEGIRQGKAALEVDDLALDPAAEVGRDDHELLLQLVVLGRIGCQLGAHGEELALDAQDDGMAAAVRDEGPGRPQRGDRLVDSAVGLRTRTRLFAAPAVEEPGLALIAGLGDDALSRDGDVLGSAAREEFLRPLLQHRAMAGECQWRQFVGAKPSHLLHLITRCGIAGDQPGPVRKQHD